MAPKKPTLPAPLPNGWILRDTEKKDWRLGKVIGKGGFGLIHLASDRVDEPVREDTDYVIKVEFYENGPLFSELKFYQRATKPGKINKWKRDKRLDFLGIPTYWGSGHSEYNGTRYRFMVMDRLGTDLQKVIVENGGQLKKQTVLQLGCLMLDVLEYIHENEYVHADIKAANLLLGYKDPGKIYLADYGLSYRYCPNGEHKEYKENPKKGHNGTIEYTSMDAHKGVASSRRGDLEVLGYCLLHWQCGTLPWLSALRNPVQVQEAKAKLTADLPDSVIQMSAPDTTEIANFLLSVRALGYTEKPDYQALRKVLSEAGLWGPLDLSRPKAVETARPAMSRSSSPAKPSARSTRPRAVTADEDGNWAKTKSIPAKVRYRTQDESKTIEQEPWKASSAAKSKPVAIYSEEEYKEDHLQPRVHPKRREGAKQRQKREQMSLKSGAMKTEEVWMYTSKQTSERELHPRFSKNVGDQWGRKSHLWDDYYTSEDDDYRENPNQNHNCWEEDDCNGHQLSGRVYGHKDDQYRNKNWNNLDKSENKHYTQWGLKILIIVVLLLCCWLLLTLKKKCLNPN